MKSEIKEKIRESAYTSPFLTAITAALFAVVIFSLPSLFKVNDDAAFISHLICRTATAVAAFYAAKACGFKLFAKTKPAVAEIIALILGFAVCVNNFPIIGFLTGSVALTENARIVRYIVYCVAIGAAEEFVFRGFVMPLVGLKIKGEKCAPFKTVAVSSAIFALCHLFNVFSAGILPTLLQVCYTFLTGGLFGSAYLFTENLGCPIVLHILFDLGGLVFSRPFGISEGNMWDLVTVIITAALGIVTAAVYVYKLCKYKSKNYNSARNQK